MRMSLKFQTYLMRRGFSCFPLVEFVFVVGMFRTYVENTFANVDRAERV